MTGGMTPTVCLAVILAMAAAVRLILSVKSGVTMERAQGGMERPYGQTWGKVEKPFLSLIHILRCSSPLIRRAE